MFKKSKSIGSAAFMILFILVGPVMAEVPPPITLAEGLKIVAAESRVVKIARLNELIAESDAHMARAALLPQINVSAGHTNLAHQPAMAFNGLAVNTSDSQYYSYSISIQQILFDFLGSLSRYQAGCMLVEAKKFDSARIRNAIAFEFTLAYFDFLAARHLVAATTQEIARLEAHLRDATQLYQAGVITRNDLLQVQVRLSDARQKLLSATNQQAVNAARLNNLLLRPLNSEVRAEEGQAPLTPPSGLALDQAWEEATKSRAEIQIVDRTLLALDLETTAQKAEFLPKVYVRGANDYMENSYQVHENNWSLMVGVNLNLFDGGRNLADLRKTQTRKKQLLEHRAKLVDEIKLELQRYTLDLNNAYARILANRDAAGQAQENLRINKKRYEEGEGTATEVLDAVTLLTTAETNHIRSVYDYRKAEAAAHYAIGTDLLTVYR